MQYMLLIYDNENAWAALSEAEAGTMMRRVHGRSRRTSPRAATTRAATRSSRPRPPRRFESATASVRRPTGRSPKRASSSAATTSSTPRISTRPSASRSEFRRRARARSRCVRSIDAPDAVVSAGRDPKQVIARTFREESATHPRDAHPPPRRLRRRRGGAAGRVRHRRRAVDARAHPEQSAHVARSARRAYRAIDRLRRDARLSPSAVERARADRDSVESRSSSDDDESGVEDDRLRLIFTCCHPALAREAQVALTLRTICGLTTEEIARAFLVPVADDGAAARARHRQDSRRADSVSRSAADRARRATRRGAGGRLPRVHRGLRGDERRRRCSPRAVRRSDSARPAARRADADGERSAGPARAHAAARRAARRAS